jgi:hypothetical protein
MSKTLSLKLLVVTTTIITLAVNVLAVTLPINNKTTQQLSDQYPVYFVPAGYVFAIWGIIYIGMIIFSVYQLISSEERFNNLRSLFIISNIANAAWIVFWHYEYVNISVAIMLVLLASLILAYQRIAGDGLVRLLAVRVPFGIYLGWISVATIANVTVALYKANWDGLGLDGITWAVIMIVVATLLGLIMTFFKHDISYTAVIVWSLVGIYVKFATVQTIAAATIFGSIILVLAIVVQILRQWQRS